VLLIAVSFACLIVVTSCIVPFTIAYMARVVVAFVRHLPDCGYADDSPSQTAYLFSTETLQVLVITNHSNNSCRVDWDFGTVHGLCHNYLQKWIRSAFVLTMADCREAAIDTGRDAAEYLVAPLSP